MFLDKKGSLTHASGPDSLDVDDDELEGGGVPFVSTEDLPGPLVDENVVSDQFLQSDTGSLEFVRVDLAYAFPVDEFAAFGHAADPVRVMLLDRRKQRLRLI